MKTYIVPETLTVKIQTEEQLLNIVSGVGNEYKADDVTYSRRNKDIWDDEDED